MGSSAPSRKEKKKSSRRPISRTSVSHEKRRGVWGHGTKQRGEQILDTLLRSNFAAPHQN